MVFLAERKHVVAKREEEVVVAVMLRLIKRLCLRDQLLVLLNQRRRNLERPRIIGHHVQFVGRGLPRFGQRDGAKLTVSPDSRAMGSAVLNFHPGGSCRLGWNMI